MQLGSFTIRWVGLQPRLETDEHLPEIAVNRLCLTIFGGDIFSLTENVRPAPPKIAAKGWIRCPSIANDRSREILDEGFCGNIVIATVSDCIERVLASSECPDPGSFTVSFGASFVNMDDLSGLSLTADPFVFAATGERSALGRVPCGCT